MEIWFQDEARIGQKNGLVRQWARRGTRPIQPADQRYDNAYLFGAICPARGVGAALALPYADTDMMQLHLDEISSNVAAGAHAVLLLDRAGWHTTGKLDMPANITPIFLPSRAPELNPVENVWQYLRQNWISNTVFENYDAIVDAACDAWRRLIADPEKIHIHRNARMGSRRSVTMAFGITQILASGADSDDVTGLEQKGYTPAEIAKFLGEGAYPPDLLDLKKQGYTVAEISTIVASKAKASGSKQAGSGGGGAAAPDTISIEIKFIIVTNGNVTPTWKLLRVSANTGSSPLFGTGRTRTHDLIITIGPNTQATQFTHLASQIGNAVANDNRSGLAVTNPGF